MPRNIGDLRIAGCTLSASYYVPVVYKGCLAFEMLCIPSVLFTDFVVNS